MTVSKVGAPANRLLAALSLRDRQLLLASCEHVELPFAEVLCESDDIIRHVYFPLDSFISLVTALEDGSRLEVGIIGSEGILGMSLVLGVNICSHHAVVQGAGMALRMNVSDFKRHYNNSAPLQQVLHRYVYVLMRQLALTAACTHFHLVEARLARWLLLTRDRAHSDNFQLTHEFLGFMLGVRRVGITTAASALNSRGLITYNRGNISIIDGVGLERASCRCYRQGNAMYEKTLGPRRAARILSAH